MPGGRPRTWVTWGGRAGRTEDQGSRRESGCVGGNPVRAQAASWAGWGPGSCDAGSGQGRALALLGGEGQGAAATAQEPCPGGDSRANTGEPGGGGVSPGVTAPGWGRQPWVSAPNPQAWLWLPPGELPPPPLSLSGPKVPWDPGQRSPVAGVGLGQGAHLLLRPPPPTRGKGASQAPRGQQLILGVVRGQMLTPARGQQGVQVPRLAQ